MSKSREYITISSDNSSEESLELSTLIKQVTSDGINKNSDLCYKIGSAYYNEKLSEFGNQAIVRINTTIRNDEFDGHKHNAYIFFDVGDYENALSSFNNTIRKKYTRVINRFRPDIKREYFCKLGISYYFSTLLKKEKLQNKDKLNCLIENIQSEISMASVNSNSNSNSSDENKSAEIVTEIIKPEVDIDAEEVTPEVISKEDETTFDFIDEFIEINTEIQDQAQPDSAIQDKTSANQDAKEYFYKKKKFHLFSQYTPKNDVVNENTLQIKLDAPIMNKKGKGKETLTIAEPKKSDAPSVNININNLYVNSVIVEANKPSAKRNKRFNWNVDEEYVPTKKSKK